MQRQHKGAYLQAPHQRVHRHARGPDCCTVTATVSILVPQASTAGSGAELRVPGLTAWQVMEQAHKRRAMNMGVWGWHLPRKG